jgi:hypothetical protein
MARTRRAAASSPVEVTAIRLPDGLEAGVVCDADGLAVIAGLGTVPGGPRCTGFTLAELEALLDPLQAAFGTVQVILHADLAPGDQKSDLTDAYDNLGYHRIPRSQSAWIVLRPAEGASASALAEQAAIALGRLPGRLRGQLADACLASELVAVISPPESDGIAYQITCWPLAGLSALQQALMIIPALSVTTTVTLRRTDGGQVRLSATTWIATGQRLGRHELDRAVAAAAARCGSCLVPLTGAHQASLVSLRRPGRQARPTGWFGRTAVGTLNASQASVIPIAGGGVGIGTADDGELVTIPLFTERGVRAAALGDAGLPKLLALRALGAGARVHVVTSNPAPWLTLRDEARLPADLMAIVHPGTPAPADSTRAAPWLIIDDTGTPAAAAVARPWQAYIAAPDTDAVTIAGLRGLDAIILHRSTPACRAAVIVAMELPVPVVQSLHGIPRDVIAIARPGTVRLVPLTPAATEQALLVRSMPAQEEREGSGWPGSPLAPEPDPPIWSGSDSLLVPELTGAVSIGAYNGGPRRADA